MECMWNKKKERELLNVTRIRYRCFDSILNKRKMEHRKWNRVYPLRLGKQPYKEQWRCNCQQKNKIVFLTHVLYLRMEIEWKKVKWKVGNIFCETAIKYNDNILFRIRTKETQMTLLRYVCKLYIGIIIYKFGQLVNVSVKNKSVSPDMLSKRQTCKDSCSCSTYIHIYVTKHKSNNVTKRNINEFFITWICNSFHSIIKNKIRFSLFIYYA